MPPVQNPFNSQEFLNTYWQQAPLLKRNALSLHDIITADELAGLATEAEVESRLISGSNETEQWTLQHGPFSDDVFQTLPERDWTLLVQAVDHWVPEVRQVLAQFSFLPRWRIDDIMISFATDGGGVGPHFDQYDVFLVQLAGQREWKIGQMCDEDSDLVENIPVKVLSAFEEQDAWVLDPGDVLYLPPGVAHWGTSLGDSMTLSVGFRAPSDSETIAELGHFMSSMVSDFQRYGDAGISQRNQTPHAIEEEDIDRVQAIIKRLADDRSLVSEWFGQYVTEPKYDDMNVDTQDWSDESFMKHWQHHPLYRNPGSRLAYREQTLFVDGQSYGVNATPEELHLICDCDVLPYNHNVHIQRIALQLLNAGALIFED
ncbi:cupin domain-containing protein [Reinekea blandensis]|nr:cupin domain-containing protein [Reinekea blandensis]